MNRRGLTLLLACAHAAIAAAPFRPPAVPLVVHDPYFSIWSMADRLTDEPTRHWTGTPHALTSLIRVDGRTYRLMGAEPADAEPLPQARLEVQPTRSVYEFEGHGVHATLTFLSPLLPDDLEVLARPVTYLTWEVRSADGKPHAVSLYFDASTDITVNRREQPAAWSRFRLGDLDLLRAGSQQQPVLEKAGNDLRIDWGYLYVAAHRSEASSAACDGRRARAGFSASGILPDADDLAPMTSEDRRAPALAFAFDLGTVTTPAARHLLVAYDDFFSVEYFHRRLRPYWRRKGAEASDLLLAAERGYGEISRRAAGFDARLTASLERAGGEQYARLCALAYRQAVAGHKLAADVDGTPLLFSKECFSGGFIGTVDVTYPTAPVFLLLNPRLLEAALRPVLDYALMERWPWPYPPHDLGMYPHANGQLYGGAEKTEDRQMPVEESGNMLLLAAAIARADNAPAFAARYWPLLSRWAAYLKANGLDPQNQLSTDDFMGHLAHQANLSLKATVALGAWARLCEMRGLSADAAAYRETARAFARRWMTLADDGDHYRLAFDAPGTWSQKYNLVWDRLLGLGLFPPEVARKEIAYYKKVQDPFGLPVDSRKPIAKIDWLAWSAALAENREDFDALFSRAWRFANETPNRVPLADGYWSKDGKQRNYQNRPVVGGLFLKALADQWTKGTHD